jgi:hypothetical protein
MFAWRATEAERRMHLPGDQLVPEARHPSTHAITIHATPEEVWPWLVQMGCDRAGWYSYDRLDNGGTPSAASIRPELQEVDVGDILPSRPSSTRGFEVLRLEFPRLLLLGAYLELPGIRSLPWDAPRPEAFLRTTWGFYLQERPRETRLIVRARGIVKPRLVGFLVNALMGPAHVVMQRRQLLNIQALVEGASSRSVGEG